ncbi:MAG: hypothetical protein A2161_04410, partial [Candidatus Schekmanbacteria bacterium RBG_13_48_7]
MGTPRNPENVKLFIGILYSSEDILKSTQNILETKFGPIDSRDTPSDFIHTHYYKEEMGDEVKRCFISFERLILPDELPLIKLYTNSLEDQFRKNSGTEGRTINLDPGYMSHGTVILASTKNYSHRIYLNSGIYAELEYRILGKKWESLEWTYPDYRT